ncbi:hypothetical protein CIN_04520 [Commensalibacter intestini A911]|uniref:Ecotin n=1 Tax=Commensalibacter intestini A911 TaxID=1088868 RepID=G6EYD2_9PROT|nr:serine protease inhibitor ecotin [Commensalibacter intestini]EHD14520.1 hypothetical protein CIN_04520 [Commensalibacter intestini A911]
MIFFKKSTVYKNCLLLLTCLSFTLYSHTGQAAEKKDPMAIWPKPEKGYKQVVIQLPMLQNEELYRVELIPEKTIKTDCNRVMISGEMDTKPLTGWGYEYYVLSKINEPASTRMACIPQKIENKAIAIQTNLPFIDYNSKLPLVIYIPKNIHLSYRVWSAGLLHNAEENKNK